MDDKRFCLISVDIETTGPTPGHYSMYELGACLVDNPGETFIGRYRPISDRYQPEALAAVGRNWEEVRNQGVDPAGVTRFFSWVRAVTVRKPVFVGFNAAFDWQFVNWYFHEFAAEEMGENPFGFAPLDLKALIAGRLRCGWEDTKMSRLPEWLNPDGPLTHDALDDALQQAAIFRRLMVGPPPNWWQWLRRR